MNILELPFNRHLGLTIVERDGKSLISIDPQPEHLNHVGTLHASVLFAVAEAASGQALLSRQLDTTNTTALLRNSDIKYRSPATTKVYGVATIDDSAFDKLSQQLSARGRASIEVSVSVINENDVECVSGTFKWFVAVV